MPVVDRRDFGGRFSVSQNSKRLSNCGWCHTTPQLAFKATCGCLATEWIRKLAGPQEQEELVRWGREAVARIEGFYAGDDYEGADDVKFTFQKDGARDDRPSLVIGE